MSFPIFKFPFFGQVFSLCTVLRYLYIPTRSLCPYLWWRFRILMSVMFIVLVNYWVRDSILHTKLLKTFTKFLHHVHRHKDLVWQFKIGCRCGKLISNGKTTSPQKLGCAFPFSTAKLSNNMNICVPVDELSKGFNQFAVEHPWLNNLPVIYRLS